jgi:hypothetical protein
MATTFPVNGTWTWVVTGLNSAIITFLNRLVTNVAVHFELNKEAVFTGDVPSDNPEINIPQAGSPFVDYNSRLLYGFRREQPQSSVATPWQCRFGGILHIVEDEALSDEPITHLTAYDPWMWLRSIPVVNNDGSLPGKNGVSYTATAGNTIALNVLTNGLAAVVASNPSNPLFIDQTNGHFDTTSALDMNFQQGCSVGEAWTQLCDTGTMDIVLTPIYDPRGRPGKLCVLNIYSQAGSAKPGAVFGWDKFPRSLVGIDRLLDGTQMANVAQFYSGGTAATQQSNAGSISTYGEYWLQKNYPQGAPLSAVALVALAEVALRKKGKRTFTIDPAPERSPQPFVEYYLGDQVPVWAGRKTIGGGYSYRQQLTPGTVSGGAWTNPQRVYAIPISLSDDQVETVEKLLLTDPNV